MTNLKDTSKKRLFKNIEALRKLVKKSGICKGSWSDNSFDSILMTSKTNGIYIKSNDFVNEGRVNKVLPVRLIKGIYNIIY